MHLEVSLLKSPGSTGDCLTWCAAVAGVTSAALAKMRKYIAKNIQNDLAAHNLKNRTLNEKNTWRIMIGSFTYGIQLNISLHKACWWWMDAAMRCNMLQRDAQGHWKAKTLRSLPSHFHPHRNSCSWSWSLQNLPACWRCFLSNPKLTRAKQRSQGANTWNIKAFRWRIRREAQECDKRIYNIHID